MSSATILTVERKDPTSYLAVAFTAVAWYNGLELLALILLTFKRYNGLYFWSLLVATAVGVIPYALGNLLLHLHLVNKYVALSICSIPGWYSMVIGQALVLYSRLHLVLKDERTLRRVLIMIIVTAVLFMPSTTVLAFGSGGDPNDSSHGHFGTAYNIVEKIEMTFFCIQEFIISGLYLRETRRILKTIMQSQSQKSEPDTETSSKWRKIRTPRGRYRRTILQLGWINVFIIVIDVALLGIEYASLYTLETTFKGAVYSVKLRLEFAVLSQLVSISGHGSTLHTSETDTTFNDMSFETGLEDNEKQHLSSSSAYSTGTCQPDTARRAMTADDILRGSSSETDLQLEQPEATEQDTQFVNTIDVNDALTMDYNRSEQSRPSELRRMDTWVQDLAYR